MIFDATLYANKPDLGIPRMHQLDHTTLWDDWRREREGLPTRFGRIFQSEGGTVPDGDAVFLDIEHWPDPAGARHIATLREWSRHYPARRVGFYGVVPERDYWASIEPPQSRKYRAWQKRIELRESLAREAGIVHPSLYTMYTDTSRWAEYATAHIREAKRLGVLVYPFIWPQFHPSSEQPWAFMPAETFRDQLALVLSLADGVVIWGGWGTDGRLEWDDAAPWVSVLREFITAA